MKTSKELQVIQDYMTTALNEALAEYDFDKAIILLNEIKKVDHTRRELWNNEKFGAYEKVVDELISSDNKIIPFNSDDIPF